MHVVIEHLEICAQILSQSSPSENIFLIIVDLDIRESSNTTASCHLELLLHEGYIVLIIL